MLPKQNRLTYQEFIKNKSTVSKFHSQNFSLTFKKSKELYPRFIILVPKSLDKRSVFRHLTRRIMVEAIRIYLKNIKQPADCLLKPNKILKRRDLSTVNEEIRKLFLLAGLL